MQRALCSFATPHYRDAQQHLCKSARPCFDHIWAHSELDLSQEFVAKRQKIFRYSRGYGFWTWKPEIIRCDLLKLNAGDVLMYVDSQWVFISDPRPLFDLCERIGGVLLFHQKREGHKNATFTRRDAFIRMRCDEERFWNGPQLNCAMLVFMPCPRAFALLEEWQKWHDDWQTISDEPSTLGDELPGFRDHRHDQSILSIMAIRDGLQTFPDPSEFGNGYHQPGRLYGQILKSNRCVAPPYPIPCRSPR